MQVSEETNRSPRTLPTTFIGKLTLVLFLMVATPGCLRRRLTIRTTPPGALVSVDNQPVGISPAATGFTYYGTREIRVEKDGFRTEVIKRNLKAPWYEYPALDFITETLLPWEIRDERIIDIEMVPEEIESTNDVLSRAEQLRSQSRAGIVTAPR